MQIVIVPTRQFSQPRRSANRWWTWEMAMHARLGWDTDRGIQELTICESQTVPYSPPTMEHWNHSTWSRERPFHNALTQEEAQEERQKQLQQLQSYFHNIYWESIEFEELENIARGRVCWQQRVKDLQWTLQELFSLCSV